MKTRLPMQELRSHFNPGFIAANIYALTEGFTQNVKSGIPLSLVYVAIPLCLHTSSRNALPSSSAKKFHLWVQENQQLLIGFGTRAAAMKTRIDQGIMFAHSSSLIELTKSGTVISLKKPKQFSKLINKGDVQDCLSACSRVGKMLSKIPEPALIYYLLGVRP